MTDPRILKLEAGKSYLQGPAELLGAEWPAEVAIAIEERHARLQRAMKIGVNDAGRRVGESHQNAKLSDEDVRFICELHNYHGLGYKKLAAKFDVSWSHIRKICKGQRRTVAAVRYRQRP